MRKPDSQPGLCLVSVLSSNCLRLKPDGVPKVALNAMATEFAPARNRADLEVKAKLKNDHILNHRRNGISDESGARDSADPFGSGVRTGEAKKPGPANLRIGTWNIYGIAEGKDGEINAKQNDLQRVLAESEKKGERFDLLFVQETWFPGDEVPRD